MIVHYTNVKDLKEQRIRMEHLSFTRYRKKKGMKGAFAFYFKKNITA